MSIFPEMRDKEIRNVFISRCSSLQPLKKLKTKDNSAANLQFFKVSNFYVIVEKNIHIRTGLLNCSFDFFSINIILW